MDTKSRLAIRLSDEEKKMAQLQAEKFGLNVSEYLRMVIKLDPSTEIISAIKERTKSVDSILDSVYSNSRGEGYIEYNEEGKEIFVKVAELIDSLGRFYHVDDIRTLNIFLNEFSDSHIYFGKMIQRKLELLNRSEESM